MLEKVLSSEGCQLVRLGLAGNAFGDAGAAVLSRSLQVHCVVSDRLLVMPKLILIPFLSCSEQGHATLTFIDLRSNGISNAGLCALEGPLTSNSVLSLLDLRGNPVGQDAALSLSRQLVVWFFPFLVRVDPSKKEGSCVAVCCSVL